MFIILIFYVAVMIVSPVFTELNDVPKYIPCESGWYYWGEKCYKKNGRYQHEKISWTEALKRCKNYKGDLVSIESQQEQDFIFSFIQLDIKSGVWIGLNDRDEEGNFTWTDGSVLNYTNWNANEPSGVDGNEAEEDCVNIGFNPAHDVKLYWNDYNCNYAWDQYICEMKPNPRKRSLNPMYCSSEEHKGWKWEESCFHVVSEKKSWQDAERHCKNYYKGHLVSILDRLEDVFLDYILPNITDEMWIGIKIKEQLQQEWISGWYVSYSGIISETDFREGTCVARKKITEWITIPCTNKLSFICKVTKENPPVLKSPAADSQCPVEFEGWRDLGGEYCYYFETEKAVNFYEALFDCKRREGNLLSLHSKKEADVILPFVKYNQLGQNFYIGLIRGWPEEEEFAWTDGSTVDYVNWYSNSPNSLSEKCVEVYTNDIGALYKWNDILCEEKRGYICSAKKVSTNLPQPGEDSCKNYCISPRSYLDEVLKQSPDAIELP